MSQDPADQTLYEGQIEGHVKEIKKKLVLDLKCLEREVKNAFVLVENEQFAVAAKQFKKIRILATALGQTIKK